MQRSRIKHIVIAGDGIGGITAAAKFMWWRLFALLMGYWLHVTIIGPKRKWLINKPLQTLMGVGLVSETSLVFRQRLRWYIPIGTHFTRGTVVGIDRGAHEVKVANGQCVQRVHYDKLLISTGIAMDWDSIPGLRAALDDKASCVTSNAGYAPKTWRLVQSVIARARAMATDDTPLRMVFSLPDGRFPCPGFPLKIFLAVGDMINKLGLSDRVELIFVTAKGALFPKESCAKNLEDWAQSRGALVKIWYNREVVQVDGSTIYIRHASGDAEACHIDFFHAVTRALAPQFIADAKLGTVEEGATIDIHTCQTVADPDIYVVGDSGNFSQGPMDMPRTTGAAARKQVPVAVFNILASIFGWLWRRSYFGYSCCPIVIGMNEVALAASDFNGMIYHIPGVIERWLQRKYGLPRQAFRDPNHRFFKRGLLVVLFWVIMLRGISIPFC
jgi:sulfide:quinone oxidoreductase